MSMMIRRGRANAAETQTKAAPNVQETEASVKAYGAAQTQKKSVSKGKRG